MTPHLFPITTNALGRNNRGQLHTVTDAMGHVTTFADYNAFGQAETLTDPNGIISTRTYNSSGLVTVTTTAGLTTAYAYNPTGQLLTITLPGNRVIAYTYTAAGQVAGITDSLGNKILYTYDSEGRRTGEEVHDPQNALTRYAGYGYDDNGRMNTVTLPGNIQETSEYDVVGNLVKTINATGMQTDSTYDALNRLLTVTEAGVVTAGYGYDGQDNISRVTDAGGDVLFTFDQGDHAAGRLSRIIDSEGTDSFAYDLAGSESEGQA